MTKQVLDFRFKKVEKDDDFFSEMVGRDEGIRERGNWARYPISLGLAVALPWDLNMALLILVLFKSIKILLI